MKIKVALQRSSNPERVFLIKPWRRSETGFRWHPIELANISSQSTRSEARRLAAFLNTEVVDADVLSKSKKIVVVSNAYL